MRSYKSKKRIRSLVLLIAFTILLLIMAVYAWFSTQKNVAINNLKGRIEVAEGLQLSIDAENWAQSIEFGTNNTGLGEKISNGIVADWNQFDLGIQSNSSYYQHNGVNYVTNNIRPVMNVTDFNRGGSATDSTTGYLVPISTAGALTSDMKHIKFFTGTYSGVKLSKITQQQETVETGMYAFDIYLMNNTKGDDPDLLYLNYDSIVREIKSSLENEDYGLKNCVRVGLAFYSGETETSSSKAQVLEATYDSTISQVAIWEPNYDEHSAYAMKQNEKLRTLAENTVTDATAIESLFIKSSLVNNTIENVYTTDSSLQGLSTYNVVRTKGEIVIAEIDEKQVSSNASGIQKLKDIYGEGVKLAANKISKMRVYVWIDGQDPDCINWSSHSDGIDVNIGLIKAGAGKNLIEGNINQETVSSWKQYRDGTIPKVTNGEVTLEVGTQVSGYTAGGVSNWYVLGVEDGQLLITTNSNVTTLQLGESGNLAGCQNDYETGVSQLNNAVSSYKNPSLADSVRSINVDDINRVTGYNPATYSGYGSTKTYTSGTFYNRSEWVTASSENPVTMTSSYYYYHPDSLTTSSGGTVNGISATDDSRPAYKVLFKENGTETNATYWLGSLYVNSLEGIAKFGLRGVGNSRVSGCDICFSGGNAYNINFGVRPAVSLKSNIPVDSSGHIGIAEESTWTQYRDGTIPKVTNGTVTLEVGTEVTGYTAGGKGDGNWHVLGAENGKLLITTNSNVTTLQLGENGNFEECQNDYTTGVSQLNNAVSSYKNPSLADSVRSINVEDINRVTGYNSTTYSGYGSTKTYISGTYYNGSEWVTASTGSPVTITSNYYYYYPDSLGTSSGGTVNGISATDDSRPAYKVLFKENGTGTNTTYWLGSLCVDASEGISYFGLRDVYNGYVNDYNLCYSDGGTVSSSLGVRPAVSLKSNIPVDSSGHIGT